MSYAWIIDRDHLAEAELRATGKAEDNAKGVTGPSQAPDWMTDLLDGERQPLHPSLSVYKFRMYDDDGELYYSGRMVTDEGDTEEACYGPLGDFGAPNAGCVSVIYPGHPEMDCG